MSRSIRVSEEVWKALRVATAESGERLQALADAMLVEGLQQPSRAATNGSVVIRVSEAAHARLKHLAAEERRTMTAVLDGRLGVTPSLTWKGKGWTDPGPDQPSRVSWTPVVEPAAPPVETPKAVLERLVAATTRKAKPNGSSGVEARVHQGEDYWSATCQRAVCGHGRRVHRAEGAGGCERCVGTCRGFQEGGG